MIHTDLFGGYILYDTDYNCIIYLYLVFYYTCNESVYVGDFWNYDEFPKQGCFKLIRKQNQDAMEREVGDIFEMDESFGEQFDQEGNTTRKYPLNDYNL